MNAAPIIPACSLDQLGAAAQRERYRRVGDHAEVLAVDPRTVVIRAAPDVPAAVVEELVAVERSCCPFFGLDWDPEERRMAVSVSRPEDEPALEAITYALGTPD
jgi:hypothetical protein